MPVFKTERSEFKAKTTKNMFVKVLSKQSKIIFAGIGIIVLLGVIGGGYYWWMGTPEYSVSQIKKAIETHNPELGLKYIDTDAVFENLWTDISWDIIGPEGGVALKRWEKPEALLKRIIELTTNPKDLVLDYHVGSGTTVAVAHKLDRHYIGIEQLDYDKNDSVIRLKNVINRDTTGISN